eukprot:TRINITY_DN19424_c0_g1_i1.p1 TRINITY_DN19424_c0_g1~~TRINITY_DN19424_c0_g1_i1.p1  ORF type:complete len:223 (-),score=60.67 TRINITY_DN19424_c0_g1_i1:206-790(-)
MYETDTLLEVGPRRAAAGEWRRWCGRNFQAAPHLLAMLLVSVLTFYTPGIFPLLGGGSTGYMTLNSEFLVLPSVGAALAGLVKCYYLSLLTLLQLVLFLFILLPVMSFSHSWIPASEISMYIFVGLFNVLSGYANTMVYLAIRHDVAAGALRDTSTEKLCRIAGFIFQIGATFGVLASLASFEGGLFVDMDSSD